MDLGQPIIRRGMEPDGGKQSGELTLVDLALVLVRHRALIGGIVAAAIIAGVGLAWWQEPVYSYSASIELGGFETRDGPKRVESADAVQAKLQEAFVPMVRQKLVEEGQPLYKIDVKAPQQSSLVLLESQGTAADGAAIRRQYEAVMMMLQAQHQPAIEQVRNRFERQLANAKAKLADLESQDRLLRQELARNDASREVVQRQLDKMQENIEQMELNWPEHVNNLDANARPQSLVLIATQLLQARNRVAVLEERLNVMLPNDRGTILEALGENTEKRRTVQDEIDRLNASLDSLHPTGFIKPPSRGAVPTGPGPALIVALFTLVGVMIGLAATLGLEFLHKVRDARSVV